MHEFVHTARRLFASRQFQQAVKVCRLGLLGDPTCLEGHIVLGQALLSLARYDEVVAEARAALEIQDTSAEATVLLGEALFFKGAYGQAREVLRKAAALDPDNNKVARLLAELDATASVGLHLDASNELPDETRSYPTAEEDITAIGDETEIQDAPPDMLPPDADSAPMPAVAPGSPQTPPAAMPPAAPLPGGPAPRPFVQEEPPDDEDRPDPVAGEVQVQATNVPDMPPPAETVDLSGANLPLVDPTSLPDHGEPEASQSGPAGGVETASPVPTLRTAGPPEAPQTPSRTPTAAATPPRPGSGSRPRSGRRWVERRWVQSENAQTREAVVVPSPKLSTQEMESSDLFGRGNRLEGTSTQLLKKDSGRNKMPGAIQARDTEQGTATAIERPDGSGSRLGPPRELPAEVAAHAPFAAGEEGEEETAPLKRPSSAPRAGAPLGSGSQPTPSPDLGIAPRGSAPDAQDASRRPGLGAPSGSGAPRPAPPSPGLGASGRPLSPGSAAGPGQPFSTPGGTPRPPLPGRGGLGVGSPPEISGLNFEPPPAAPPPGVKPLGPLPPPRQPAPVAPGAPAGPLHAGRGSRPTGVARGSGVEPAPQRPSSSARARSLAGTAPAAPTPRRQVPLQPGQAAAGQVETTARSRISWRWWLRRHRTWASVASGILVLAVGILILLSARTSDSQKQTRRLARQARAALRKGTFRSLRRADRLLLSWLRHDRNNRSARSLRLLTAALLAVEHGGSVERPRDLARQVGNPEDAQGQAGLVLATLAEAKVDKALRLARNALRTHPSSGWLAFAHATVRIWQGRPDIALTGLAGLETGEAHLFVTRSQVRARITMGQVDEALGLLDALKPEVQRAPWAVVLRARAQLARGAYEAIPRAALDGLVGLLALSRTAVGTLQRKWAHVLLAEIYDRLGKDSLRAKHAAAALAIDVKAEPPALAEAVARHLLGHGQPARALQIAARVHKICPERAEAVAIAARAALTLSDAKRALALVSSLASERRSVAVRLLRVEALEGLGRRKEAVAALHSLRRDKPEDPQVRLASAHRLLRDNRAKEALQEVEAVLRQHPRMVEAISLAARIERSLGKPTDAAMRFEAAVRLHPKDPSLRAALVDALVASGDLRSATNALDAAEEAFPSSLPLQVARGRLLLQQGQVEQAIERFQELKRKGHRDPEVRLGLAEALLYARRVKEAASVLSGLGAEQPRRVDLLRGWLSRLRWDRAKGDPQTAVQRLERAAQGEGAAAYHAAMLLLDAVALRWGRRAAERRYRALGRRLGRRPELDIGLALARLDDDANQSALRLLRRAQASRLTPRLHPSLRAELLARMAQAHWQAGNFSAARREAQRALRHDPHCPRAQAILGIVAYEARRLRSARRNLEKALALDERLALTRYYLGMVYLQYGQRSKARPHLRAYLSLRPKGPLAPDARMALRR